MSNNDNIHKIIKDRRLELNITMGVLAKRTGISRATLSSIENGNYNCSFSTILKIFSELQIEFHFSNINAQTRKRATRLNNSQDKKINKFIIMCIENYADQTNTNSKNVYEKMKRLGVINDLKNDYKDLHGMSQEYLNQYISTRLKQI